MLQLLTVFVFLMAGMSYGNAAEVQPSFQVGGEVAKKGSNPWDDSDDDSSEEDGEAGNTDEESDSDSDSDSDDSRSDSEGSVSFEDGNEVLN